MCPTIILPLLSNSQCCNEHHEDLQNYFFQSVSKVWRPVEICLKNSAFGHQNQQQAEIGTKKLVKFGSTDRLRIYVEEHRPYRRSPRLILRMSNRQIRKTPSNQEDHQSLHANVAYHGYDCHPKHLLDIQEVA